MESINIQNFIFYQSILDILDITRISVMIQQQNLQKSQIFVKEDTILVIELKAQYLLLCLYEKNIANFVTKSTLQLNRERCQQKLGFLVEGLEDLFNEYFKAHNQKFKFGQNQSIYLQYTVKRGSKDKQGSIQLKLKKIQSQILDKDQQIMLKQFNRYSEEYKRRRPQSCKQHTQYDDNLIFEVKMSSDRLSFTCWQKNNNSQIQKYEKSLTKLQKFNELEDLIGQNSNDFLNQFQSFFVHKNQFQFKAKEKKVVFTYKVKKFKKQQTYTIEIILPKIETSSDSMQAQRRLLKEFYQKQLQRVTNQKLNLIRHKQFLQSTKNIYFIPEKSDYDHFSVFKQRFTKIKNEGQWSQICAKVNQNIFKQQIFKELGQAQARLALKVTTQKIKDQKLQNIRPIDPQGYYIKVLELESKNELILYSDGSIFLNSKLVHQQSDKTQGWDYGVGVVLRKKHSVQFCTVHGKERAYKWNTIKNFQLTGQIQFYFGLKSLKYSMFPDLYVLYKSQNRGF